MQEKRKRSKTGIIVAAGTIVAIVILMVAWGKYEESHKEELNSSFLSTDGFDVVQSSASDWRPEEKAEVEKPRRIVPDDPEKICAMVEEAFKDEGYFDEGDILKGFHVYSLLKKCLDNNGDCSKIEQLAKRLKERSSKTYGAWHVETSLLADLDDSLKKAMEQT